MGAKEANSVMADEELEALVRDAITPIDFEGLIRAGVIEKRGAAYVILKWDELPAYAKSRIKTAKSNKNKEVLVTFRPVSKRLEKLHHRLRHD